MTRTESDRISRIKSAGEHMNHSCHKKHLCDYFSGREVSVVLFSESLKVNNCYSAFSKIRLLKTFSDVVEQDVRHNS